MTNRRFTVLAIAAISSCLISCPAAFQQRPAPINPRLTQHGSITTSVSSSTNLFSSVPERNSDQDNTSKNSTPPLSTIVKRVAVAGATGRTGKYVVQNLLKRNVPVLALVRDTAKADAIFKDLLGNESNNDDNIDSLLTVRKTDLGSKEDVLAALKNNDDGIEVDAAIWCATGFSDSPDQSFWDKLQTMFGMVIQPKGSIDSVGLPAMGEFFAETPKRTLGDNGSSSTAGKVNGSGGSGVALLPKVVMLSSAGVTRPKWSDEKKMALEGSAGIPIVRLNPFGLLDLKRESEDKLRQCGAEYVILRPGGLNDNWPPNQRPIFSQGDVAVGRINRQDVAKILVDLLSTPECTGKTFEVLSIANSDGYYPPASSIGVALGRLQLDSENGGKGPSEEVVHATYAIMQQLIPGEKQDPSLLAMGQTYEQLDREEVGRYGRKGEEKAEEAFMDVGVKR